MADTEPLGDALLVDRSPEVGSPRLAAALEAMDLDAIAAALRTDLILVPQLEREDGTRQTRVFGFGDDTYHLLLFSSAETLAAFLRDDPQRTFALQGRAGLLQTLVEHHDLLGSIVFDPAGPHAVQASPADVARALDGAPEPIRPGMEPYPADRDPAAATTLGLDIVLTDDWFVIDLEDAATRDNRVRELADRQLAGTKVQPALRQALIEQLRTAAIQAGGVGGRIMAYLVRHNEDAALALTSTLFWHPLGRAERGKHFDARVAAIRERDPDADLELGDSNAGPYARHVRVDRGPDSLGAAEIQVLLVDYWLEFPDHRGLARVAFSSPHMDLRQHLLRLADNIVLQGQWVLGVESS